MPVLTKRTGVRLSRAAGTRYVRVQNRSNLTDALLSAVGSFVNEFGVAPHPHRTNIEITGDTFGYSVTVFEAPEED